MNPLVYREHAPPPARTRSRWPARRGSGCGQARGRFRYALWPPSWGGERRLQRIFREHVGLTPKEAARVARLRAALDVMRAGPTLPLGRVALRAGYYDQPHFNREFARLAGVAPGAWRVASVQSPPPPDA